MSASVGQGLFVGVVLLYATVLSLVLIRSIQQGSPRATALLALLAGPPPGLIVWFGLQKGQPDPHSLTLQNISYSATLGDLLALIPILVLGAVGYQKYGDQLHRFWKRPLWIASAMGVGYLEGIFFHWVLGGIGNSSEAEVALHYSATSWTHNLGVVPVFTSTLLVAVVPLFTVKKARRLAMIATAIFVVGWGGLVWVDILRMQLDPANPWHFDPHWLDAAMDWSRWTVRS